MDAPTQIRQPRPTPPFLPSMWRVFDLSVGLLLWSRRTIFMGLLVGGPVALAVLLRVADILGHAPRRGAMAMGGEEAFGLMFWLFYVRFIVPILAVFYGTALVADEVEDKTITYLFTRPIRRGAVLAGKYVAYLLSTVLVVLPSLLLVYFLVMTRQNNALAANFPALLTDLAIVVAALAVYGAVFAFVGARFSKPLVTGLAFLFGWEPAVLLIPGYLKRFTVMYYIQGLVPHAMPIDEAPLGFQAMFRDSMSVPVGLFALAGICAAFLYLALRTIERREFVLEQ